MKHVTIERVYIAIELHSFGIKKLIETSVTYVSF